MVGWWCDGAGKLSVPRRSTNLIVGQVPSVLAVGADWGAVALFGYFFSLSFPLCFFLPPSLRDGPIQTEILF